MTRLPPRGLRPRLLHLRVVVTALVLLTTVALAFSFATNEGLASDQGSTGDLDRTLVATIDGTGPGQIVAYGPDGTVTFRNESLKLYHDVDPGPAGDATVTYVASDEADRSRCDEDRCLLNVVRRVNLSTGEGERVHAWVDARNGSTQIHDVDRVNESVLLVGDINYPDRVFMVNTTTDEMIWEWRVAEAYDPSSGGVYPGDWTHLNDVEYLEDGRVMVSLRNQDQVVFIEPGEGVQDSWTLGADDDHDVLYEQHNPDYIPAERGGPAVVVADSENNRVVEYQRRNGSWERSWTWSDTRLQWPRDADRMPDGNTVVADSHGSRIFGVAPDGDVAWSRPFPDGAYDVEVLGTGDESNGSSATRAGLVSRSRAVGGLDPAYRAVSLVPPVVLHGLLFALPSWTTPLDATLLLALGITVVVWVLTETGVFLGRRYRLSNAKTDGH